MEAEDEYPSMGHVPRWHPGNSGGRIGILGFPVVAVAGPVGGREPAPGFLHGILPARLAAAATGRAVPGVRQADAVVRDMIDETG